MQSPNGRQPTKTGDLLGFSSSGKSGKAGGTLIDVGGESTDATGSGGVDLLASGVPEDTFNKYAHLFVCSLVKFFLSFS